MENEALVPLDAPHGFGKKNPEPTLHVDVDGRGRSEKIYAYQEENTQKKSHGTDHQTMALGFQIATRGGDEKEVKNVSLSGSF